MSKMEREEQNDERRKKIHLGINGERIEPPQKVEGYCSYEDEEGYLDQLSQMMSKTFNEEIKPIRPADIMSDRGDE